MSFVTIPDWVPSETIDALTNEAMAEYLQRHGWARVQAWTHRAGAEIATWEKADDRLDVPVSHRFADHAQRMAEAIGFVVRVDKQRVADVIAELQGIQQEVPT